MVKFDWRRLDIKLITFFKRAFVPVARVAIFVTFFWFGFIKLLGVSPAAGLARALTEQTVGLQYFDVLFVATGLLECLIAILFLLPKMTRVVVPLLLFHLVVVCSPLLLLPDHTWQSFLVPTLEGQYIIKNAVFIAVAIGIAASAQPVAKKRG